MERKSSEKVYPGHLRKIMKEIMTVKISHFGNYVSSNHWKYMY